LDFGIAKRSDAKEFSRITASEAMLDKDVAVTAEGVILGTLPYLSPEQWRSEDVDAHVDLWAVGIILYELCAGEHPLAPLSIARLAQIGDLDKPMPSVRDKRPDMGALSAVIDRCLKKRKAERFGSAEELLAALSPLLPSRTVKERSGDDNPFPG